MDSIGVSTIVGGWLLNNHCPTGTKGFGYLKRCLELAAHDPMLTSNINKGLFDRVAFEDDTSSQNINRNIGTLIDMWWPSLHRLKLFLEKPTNKELIIKLSTIIRNFLDAQAPRKMPRPMGAHVCVMERVFG